MNNYAPDGKWLWDSWFINRGDECHMFHLQCDIIDEPEQRHFSGVSIGHAVSKNYIDWEEQPTALLPGAPGEWDDADLWTGSAAEKDGVYYLYYTGKTKAAGQERLQKVGVATSTDLQTWQKHQHNPIVEAAEQYYQMDNELNAIGNFAAWRDPFVFKDPHSEKRYMTISARAQGPKREFNGCVGLAESDDMINWKVLPPILTPGTFDAMEVTRVIYHNGLYYLFFSSYNHFDPTKRHEFKGLHCYYSEDLQGEYKPVNGDGIICANGEAVYDIRVLHVRDNEFIGIGWLNYDEAGNFVGKLSHPMHLSIEGDRVSVL